MRAHQDKLITTIFNYDNRREFLDKVNHPLTVETWDGEICAFMSVDYVGEMFREVCFFGPLAAMYGREVQQLLMANETPDKISMEDFQYSVDMGRRSIKQTALRSPLSETMIWTRQLKATGMHRLPQEPAHHDMIKTDFKD